MILTGRVKAFGACGYAPVHADARNLLEQLDGALDEILKKKETSWLKA